MPTDGAVNEEEVREYVGTYAPELEPGEVIAFMIGHDKPEDEISTHVQWATRMLRRQAGGEVQDGPSLGAVADAMRRHDERRLSMTPRPPGPRVVHVTSSAAAGENRPR